jgi:hypothetical protein
MKKRFVASSVLPLIVALSALLTFGCGGDSGNEDGINNDPSPDDVRGGNLICFGDIPCPTGGVLEQCADLDLTECAWIVDGEFIPCTSCQEPGIVDCSDEAIRRCDGE